MVSAALLRNSVSLEAQSVAPRLATVFVALSVACAGHNQDAVTASDVEPDDADFAVVEGRVSNMVVTGSAAGSFNTIFEVTTRKEETFKFSLPERRVFCKGTGMIHGIGGGTWVWVYIKRSDVEPARQEYVPVERVERDCPPVPEQ